MGETASAPGELYPKVADEAEERVTLDEALRRIGFGYAQARLGHTTRGHTVLVMNWLAAFVLTACRRQPREGGHMLCSHG